MKLSLIAAGLVLCLGAAYPAQAGAPAGADQSLRLASLERIIGGADKRPARPDGQQLAVACNKLGEKISGDKKICYYDCVGTTASVTVKSSQDCPASIDR